MKPACFDTLALDIYSNLNKSLSLRFQTCQMRREVGKFSTFGGFITNETALINVKLIGLRRAPPSADGAV